MSGDAKQYGRAGSDESLPMQRRSGIAAATLLCIVSVLVFIIQPGYLQGLVDHAGISSVQAGYIASMEMTGYATTMILFALISHRVRWPLLLRVCIAVQAIGNFACILHPRDAGWLSIARLVAGLGAGGLTSLSFTAIGMTKDPDRQFGFFIMWVLVYGAVGLFALPSLLIAIGLNGFYLAVFSATIAAFALIRFMPSHSATQQQHGAEQSATLSVAGRALAVASIFVFFTACGALWAYLSLVGTARGLGTQPVANALGLSQFTGVAGALVAGMLGARFGRFWPLSLSLLVCAASTLALERMGAGMSVFFAIMVGLFNFGWNLAQPFYLAAATGFDSRGRLVTQMAASQACGLAIGPFFGAALGGETHANLLLAIVAALFMGAIGLISPSFIEVLRRRDTFEDLALLRR